jgi:mycothiol synthase
MTITSCPYQDDDLPALQTALANWIQQQRHDTGYCHIGDIPHRIYNGIRGRLPLSELVRIWKVHEQILGFALAQPFYNTFDVYMNPQYYSNKIAQEIFQWAYQTSRKYMNQIGRKDKSVNNEVAETDTNRQKILTELGFVQGKNWINDTLRDLSEPIPESALPDGYSIRPAAPDDYVELAAVHSGSFGSDWSPELYRDEVMSKPGYDAEREMVLVAPDGRFAAFLIYWLDELNKIGLFEPVGTHSDFQRKGLGRALMNHTLCIMREHGMQNALVGHTTDNPASTHLYKSVGFKLHHQIYEYKKEESQ